MIRVGFTGVPGAGKTTTARAVAVALAEERPDLVVELVPEYARRNLGKGRKIKSVQDQFRVLRKQVGWEDDLPGEVHVVLTDSPIFLGFAYAMDMDAKSEDDVVWTNDLFSEMNRLNYPRRYDVIFHLPPVRSPRHDGVRPLHQFDPSWRSGMDFRIRAALAVFPPRVLKEVTYESIADRVPQCVEAILEALLDEVKEGVA